MVPLEVGVAEVRGMDRGDVGMHNAFRKHFAHSFPALLPLPCCMSSVSLFWLWCCLPDLNRQAADAVVNRQVMAHRVFTAAS